MIEKNFAVKCAAFASLAVMLISLSVFPSLPLQNQIAAPGFSSSSAVYTGSTSLKARPSSTATLDYNPLLAIQYAQLIHSKYYHTAYYPAGINESILQKNLDHFGSEDCAHFVSEALIAGGLSVLASNPPGDNLTGFDNGAFVGSYGIVGVYRLADYLAGYDLPVFPANRTTETTIGYQPIPASYAGSPHASVYYVLNESVLPSYVLSPGDVIVDGGAGNGHAMLYTGNGKVIQTDPAGEWIYAPGVDFNISFYSLLTLNGKNVSALYIHMPTFSGTRSVNITALVGGDPLNATSARVSRGSAVTLIASFPDGVGYGNYTYNWYVNGHRVSSDQSFVFHPATGENNITVVSAGSYGNATSSYSIFVPPHAGGNDSSPLLLLVSSVAVVACVAVIFVIHRKRK
ncbi:MAG: hypothetical protein KIS30_08560 [Thermoplasmata archaeon]|nr:hypothetical protein [Candidatus Sysuiplasma acidicola]MBX8646791.1 hypothetical protein [Candidatus Sysuiplasma acidicola]